jgi:glycosyltransferase involved in cell wall biosynthesis
LGYRPQHVVIGKIARLFKLKGHDDVIEAARGVVDACPDVRFLLVGDGVLRQSLDEAIRSAGLGSHFHFAGLVPPERVAELLGAMDIVVHASLREGLARVLPQALIAGRPVVSYDIDGAREVVIPGQTGFLLPPRDVGGLRQSLITLAGDADLRRRLGAEGRRRFTQVFRHEHMTQQIRALYLRLLESRKNGG